MVEHDNISQDLAVEVTLKLINVFKKILLVKQNSGYDFVTSYLL